MTTIAHKAQPQFRSGWRRQRFLIQGILYFGLTIAGIFILFPFYYMILSSLREPFYSFERTTLDLLPSAFNLLPYTKIFTTGVVGMETSGAGLLLSGFKNTLFLEVTIVGLSTILNAMAAYVFSKRLFPGKKFLFNLLLVSLILPGEVTLIPKYILFKDLNILNTFWVLILPSLTGLGGIFLMRQFINGIPDALLDAARIDGAGELRVVTDIIFPLAIPVMSTYALMTFLGVWNDMMGPLLFLDNPPSLWTLQLVLLNLYGAGTFVYGSAYQDATGMRMQIMFAGLIVSALPTFLIYVIFQRQLVQGIVITGLKG